MRQGKKEMIPKEMETSSRIKMAVGLIVFCCTSFLSLIEFIYFYIIEDRLIIETLQEPSVGVVFITGVFFLLTSFFFDRTAKFFQVLVIFLSGFFSATQAGSGDFTSFVIVGIGYLLAAEYGFMKKYVVLKSSLLGAVYFFFFIFGLIHVQELNLIIAVHTLLGAGMVFFISLELLRANLKKEELRRTELETKVKQRTVDLQQTLHEKEALLREVHHRTKNNMQLILSLLNIEYSEITDQAAIKAARKSMRRIEALSSAHDYLHHSDKIENINVDEYLDELLNLFSVEFDERGIRITRKYDDSVGANIDAAIPLGLIVNELIDNTIQHAFQDVEGGEISLSFLRIDDEVVLKILDNGIGLPEDFDALSADSKGLHIVLNLIDQLGGTYEINRGNGTTWRIAFPLEIELISPEDSAPRFYTL